MKITVIGGTRFIGHASAEHLVARGHDVAVIHRGEHRCEVEGVRAVRADRDHPQALIAALRELDPQVVIDTRAMTRSHAEVTAMALKILCVRAVVLSSNDVYAQFGRLIGHAGPEPVARVGESAPLTVPYPYRGIHDHPGGPDYDKKDVEAVFRQACEGELSAATVLRLPATYGNRDYQRRFAWIFDELEAGRTDLPHVGGATWRWTHSHVGNAAHAIALAAEQAHEGFRVFNVGERDAPTMRQRAEGMAAAMDVEIRWREVDELPEKMKYFGPMPNDFVTDTSAIRDGLAFGEIVDDVAAMHDHIDWLRRSGA